MAVTGHKSVSSLAVYQRVGDAEKVAMGQAIAKSLVPINPEPTSTIDTSEHDSDDELFSNLDIQGLDLNSGNSHRSLSNMPIFKDCQINHLIININK